jgi:hypothetical protein
MKYIFNILIQIKIVSKTLYNKNRIETDCLIRVEVLCCKERAFWNEIV